ncbi:MAG: chloride channel protein [Deltaproteobacteria bacterium]|nr:chloride channel protein [Deltaproteobacteria bacterium]
MPASDSTLARVTGRDGGPLFMVMVGIACGLAGAFGAVVFRLLIRLFQGAFFGGAEGVGAVLDEGLLAEAGDPRAISQTLKPWLLVLVPAAGGLIVGPLVYFFAREAKGHGVPEVMEAVALRGGIMRPRVVAVKTLASAISIGSGGSVGREGPIVQIGSAIGSVIGQMLGVPARQLRTIVGCGAAAGIAATFNAPIAGALFAVEVIVGDFAVTQFSPIVISAVVATVVSRYFLGNHPAFAVPEYDLQGPLELFPCMLVGILAGLVGTAFVRFLYFSDDVFARVPLPEWAKASVGGLCIGALALMFPHVLGVGYSTIGDALAGNLPIALLGVLLGVKILATSITIGSGGSGGIFAPSLFLGAMTGGFFGKLIGQWFPAQTSESGAYALITMGAMVAATTHAPLSAIIIIFELTQTIDIIPPVMAACVLSSLVAMFLSTDSIYTEKLRRRGVDIHQQDDPNVLKSLFVRDIIDEEPPVLRSGSGLDEILTLIVETNYTEIFVVDEERRLLGAVYFSELRRVLLEQEHLRALVVAGDLLVTGRATVQGTDNLDTVMQILSSENVEAIAVTDPEDPGRLVGCVHRRDVIHAHNQELLRRDLAGGVSTTVGVVDRVHQVDLGGGYFMKEVLAHRRYHGKTLRDIDLRAQAGVQVLLVRSPGGGVRVPGPDDRLDPGDRMVVAGPKSSIDALV